MNYSEAKVQQQHWHQNPLDLLKHKQKQEQQEPQETTAFSNNISKEGFHVIAMDNLITGDLANIEHLFKLEQFEFYNHDVTKFVHVPGR